MIESGLSSLYKLDDEKLTKNLLVFLACSDCGKVLTKKNALTKT